MLTRNPAACNRPYTATTPPLAGGTTTTALLAERELEAAAPGASTSNTAMTANGWNTREPRAADAEMAPTRAGQTSRNCRLCTRRRYRGPRARTSQLFRPPGTDKLPMRPRTTRGLPANTSENGESPTSTGARRRAWTYLPPPTEPKSSCWALARFLQDRFGEATRSAERGHTAPAGPRRSGHRLTAVREQRNGTSSSTDARLFLLGEAGTGTRTSR